MRLAQSIKTWQVNPMKSIYFLSNREQCQKNHEDLLLAKACEDRGLHVQIKPWDLSDLASVENECFLIRSTWDYHQHLESFLARLEALEVNGNQIYNPLSLVRWNADKIYLKEMMDQSLPVYPTEFVRLDSEETLREFYCKNQKEGIVVKPRVSASAHGTFLLSSDASEADLKNAFNELRGRDILIQKFAREIVEEGEWSLVFLAGDFSHAILKSPKNGDFRVQEEYGGKSLLKSPSVQMLHAARSIVGSLPEVPLYARVDLVASQQGALLIELELIEPFLFLEYFPESIEKFSQLLFSSKA